MNTTDATTVSLHATWYILPGCEPEAEQALKQLAIDVREQEPDTLMYVIHTPLAASVPLYSLPPSSPQLVVFFETYRNADAFTRHLTGPVFTKFVTDHQQLFSAANGHPFNLVSFLETRAGFVRPGLLA
jgi:hypothetical protein